MSSLFYIELKLFNLIERLTMVFVDDPVFLSFILCMLLNYKLRI